MSSITQVKGLTELQKFLDTLPAKMEQNVMRGALRAGAKVILEEAKRNVAVKSGALRDSLRISTNSRRGLVTASIKAGGKSKKTGADVFYANFVEFGTQGHTITGKDGRPLFFGGRYVKSVSHPGARARPFLRPALDNKSNSAVVAAGEHIKKRLATKHGIDTSEIFIEGDE